MVIRVLIGNSRSPNFLKSSKVCLLILMEYSVSVVGVNFSRHFLTEHATGLGPCRARVEQLPRRPSHQTGAGGLHGREAGVQPRSQPQIQVAANDWKLRPLWDEIVFV